MSKLILVLVLYLLVFGSLHPERSLVVAGPTQKSDLSEKIRGDGGRTGAMRLSLRRIARAGGGARSGARAGGGGSPAISNTAGGGTPAIPVHTPGTAGGGKDHQKDSYRSGAARGRWSCGGLNILLITIIISFCIQM